MQTLRLLIYFPGNKACVWLETVVAQFIAQGHQVYFLGFESWGPLHRKMQALGAEVYTQELLKKGALRYYGARLMFLLRFVRKYRIQVVYSHMQPANLIASVAQYFSAAKYVLSRHHLFATEGHIHDKIINRLGRHFIASSDVLYDKLLAEGIPSKRIIPIKYILDFNLYAKPDKAMVTHIRAQYPAQLRIVSVNRYVPGKGYETLIGCVKQLRDAGMDVKLLAVGWGAEHDKLQRLIDEYQLAECVILTGHQENVMDYMMAADVFVQLSGSEVGGMAAKEAAYLEKIVIGVRGVGDTNDYMVHMDNAILLSPHHVAEECLSALKAIYADRAQFSGFGEKLKQAVLRASAVPNPQQYEQLHVRLLGDTYAE